MNNDTGFIKMDVMEVLKGSVVLSRYFDGRYHVTGGVYDEEFDDVFDIILIESDIDKDAYYYAEVESSEVSLLLVNLIES